MIIREITVKAAFKHPNKFRNSLRRGVDIISINKTKKELIRITITSKFIKSSTRKSLFRLRIRKRLTTFTNLILRFSLRVKITLFSLFSTNHFLRQFLVSLQLFLHFFGNILVGQQFITIRNNFQEFCTLNSNIIRFFSRGKTFLDLQNISLNFFRFLGDLITRKLNKLRTLCNIRVFRITASFIGKSIIKISLRIGNFLFITRTHHLNRSESRVVGRSIDIATSGGIRNIRSTSRASNTSAAGGVAENSIRGNTSETPTSRSITRIIVAVFTVPRFLLIIELLLHILKVVLLLKSHFFLLILPIAASLYTTKESVSSTRSNITNSTSSGRTHQTAKGAKSLAKI